MLPPESSSQDLMIRQQELEQEMRGEGIKRFRLKVDEARRKDRESTLPTGQALMERAFIPVQKAIQDKMDAIESGEAHANGAYTPYLAGLSPDVLAFLSLKGVLDMLSKTTPVTRVAFGLGALCEDEVNFRTFRGEKPYLFDKILQDLNGRTQRRQDRSRLIRFVAREKQITHAKWSYNVKVALGSFLLDIVVRETGLVEMSREIFHGKKERHVLKPTQRTVEWLNRRHELCELLSPVFMPMLVEPLAWTNPWDGGYLNSRQFRLTLVKTDNRNYLEEIRNRPMPDVYDAVNVVQATPWRINTRVLETLGRFWDNDVAIAGIPRATDLPPPQKPHDYDTNPEAKRHYKRQRTLLEKENDRTKSKRLAIAKVLWISEKFKDEAGIYFPHTLDFRGRMYPVPLYLQPQGDDLCRSLLMFAYGKPLGAEGVRWLKIHGANTFGFDKASLEDRTAWTDEHEAQILQCATDPFDNRWWTTADSPWQFLAFCFEYAGYKEVGEGYVSALPVGMDGSCNGLQNFSAMLRDEVGGAAVNLVPADKVQDIYMRVADVVNGKLERLKATDEVAAKWIGHVTRKIVKRPVMTLPYSATKYGMGDQIEQELAKIYVEGRNEQIPFTPSEIHYLARVIYDSIGEVVIAARTAMDWLRQAAQIAAEEGLPVWWDAPNGLLVNQAYKKQRVARVLVAIMGRRVCLAMQKDTDRLDRQRQASGISPNFVHSCDAAHLMLTVINALGRGVDCFAMIHDSYATHAADCPHLGAALRDSFVDMYTRHDPLQKFRESLLKQLPPEKAELLPPLPPRGNLDIELVRKSTFFFH